VNVFAQWFLVEGWQATLSSTTLLIVLLQEIRLWRMSSHIHSVEARHASLMEKLLSTYQLVRRVTGEHKQENFAGDEQKTMAHDKNRG
jgi:hypothetical protein